MTPHLHSSGIWASHRCTSTQRKEIKLPLSSLHSCCILRAWPPPAPSAWRRGRSRLSVPGVDAGSSSTVAVFQPYIVRSAILHARFEFPLRESQQREKTLPSLPEFSAPTADRDLANGKVIATEIGNSATAHSRCAASNSHTVSSPGILNSSVSMVIENSWARFCHPNPSS